MRASSDKALMKEGKKMIKHVAAYKTVHQKWKHPAQRNVAMSAQINRVTRKLQAGFELYHNTVIGEIRAKHSNSASVQAVAQSSNVNLARAQKRDPNKQEAKRGNALKEEADKAEAALETYRDNGKKRGQSDAEYKKEEESLEQKAVEKRSKTKNAGVKRCNDAANANADEAKERLDTLVRNKENMSVEEYQQQYEKLDGEYQALRMKTEKGVRAMADEAKERLDTLVRNKENMSVEEYQQQYEKLDGEYQALRMKTAKGKRRRKDTINVSKGMDIAKEDIVRIAAEQLKGGNFHVPSKDDVRSKESLRRCAQFEKLFDTRDAKKIAAIFN